MRRTDVSIRFSLAALIAAWGPLWCCCGFGNLAQASPIVAAAPVSNATGEHHCHKHRAEPTSCHETADNSRKDGEPHEPGKCQCSHQGDMANLTSAGSNGINLNPILPITTFEYPEVRISAGTLERHLHIDPRNTTGPPVLQGASAQSFFCHFTL